MAEAQQPAAAAGEDKTMAILSLVFAIVLPIVGLILALISRKKYPLGTDGHGLVKAGLIVSIILTALPLLAMLVLFGFTASML
ncbi:hypothetical protein GF367_01170 [Candidatus Woesearchaeota archaeon]|nr:hypothetical protein [Candidatus Woesearchaeota archaeon]